MFYYMTYFSQCPSHISVRVWYVLYTWPHGGWWHSDYVLNDQVIQYTRIATSLQQSGCIHRAHSSGRPCCLLSHEWRN